MEIKTQSTNDAWFKYLYCCVRDAAKIQIKPSSFNEHRISPHEAKTGELEQSDKNRRMIASLKEKYQEEMRGALDDVSLIPLFMPYIEVRDKSKSSSYSCPMIIPALLNVASYTLTPPDRLLPWIQRNFLEPTYGAMAPFIIGEATRADAFFQNNKRRPPKEWREYLAFCEEFMLYVADVQSILELEGKIGYSLSLFAVPKGLALASERQSYYQHIISNYAYIARKWRQDASFISEHRLLKRYISLNGAEEACRLSEKHLFELSKHYYCNSQAYPLTYSQIEVLIGFAGASDASVVPVTGPPGTGKTTLIQELILNQYIARTIEKRSKIFLMTASNNYAVDNIIENFEKLIQPMSQFERPWTRVQSLTLTLANRGMNPKGEYIKHSGKGQGFFSKLLDRPTLKAWKENFLHNAMAYNPQLADLDAIKKFFWSNLLNDRNKNNSIIKSKLQYDDTVNTLHSLESEWNEILGQMSFSAKKSENLRLIEELRLNKSKLNNCKIALENALRKESILSILLTFLGVTYFAKLRNIKLNRIVEEFGVMDVSFTSISPSSVLKSIGGNYTKHFDEIRDSIEMLDKANEKLDYLSREIINLKRQCDNIATEFANLLPGCSIDSTYADMLLYLSQNKNSNVFWTAYHYNEACFFMECDKEMEGASKKDRVCRLFELASYIIPCLAGTLYMIPRFFSYERPISRGTQKSNALEKEWEIDVIFSNIVDILIMDESSQVSPEIPLPLFAYSKKALIVGDEKQIDPIPGISTSLEKLNRARFALGDPDFISSCHSVVDGNLICLAKHLVSSNYFLKEHYRSYDEIIEFCNGLCYGNLLKPMRGPSPRPLPPFGYVNVMTPADKRRGSRFNLGESITIVKWIESNKNMLRELYNESRLEKIIGILTPFRAQAEQIQNDLKKINSSELSHITVGTIHSFQGDEKHVMIFSPVYDRAALGGNLFFNMDDGKMLNVAVSRARDSFLVFGCMDIFSDIIGTNAPSCKLGEELFKLPENELAAEVSPPFFIKTKSTMRRIKRLVTWDEHIAEMHGAFTSAQSRVWIYSPFITEQQIQASEILSYIGMAVQRGVKVRIIVGKNNVEVGDKRLEMLKQAGAKVLTVKRFHPKTLFWDSQVLIEGSFNWLSASQKYPNKEASLLIEGDEAENYIKDAVNEYGEAVEIKKR